MIRGTDLAIWRRIFLIPFDVVIAPAAQDKHLRERLRCELPGILRWMVEGCLDWQQRGGLDAPRAVLAATEQYRADMDRVSAFVRDACTLGPEHWAWATDLYGNYTRWCTDNGESSLSQRKFGDRLTELGFTPSKVRGLVRRTGVALAVDAPRQDSQDN